MDKKTFKILSIDGGGIKGLFSVRALEQLEKKFNSKVHEHFDLICGTSTGGLIALALSLGHSSTSIANFYEKNGNLIFPPQSKLKKFFLKIKQGFFGNKYTNKELHKQLVQFFGDNKMLKDCNTYLCIPAYNISDGMPIVFKKSDASLFRDQNLNVIDVALATSAAPTYFPNHNIKGEFLPDTLCTDGGVWCNNPSLAALSEAWRYFVGEGKEYDRIQLLSISSINSTTGEEFRGGSLFTWKEKLIGTALSGQSYFANYFLESLSSNQDFDFEYKRLTHLPLTTEQSNLIDMDNASSKAIKCLNKIGTNSGVEFVSSNHEWLSQIFN